MVYRRCTDKEVLLELEQPCPDILLWTIVVGRSGAPAEGHLIRWFDSTINELTAALDLVLPEKLEALDYFDFARQALAKRDAKREQKPA